MHYLYRYICILKVFFIYVYGQLSAIKNLLYYYYYNGIVEVCTLNARSNANSPMGSILSLLRSKYDNSLSHSFAHCIKMATTVEQRRRIVLLTRCNEYVSNGFTYDEITEFIHEIACH